MSHNQFFVEFDTDRSIHLRNGRDDTRPADNLRSILWVSLTDGIDGGTHLQAWTLAEWAVEKLLWIYLESLQ